MHDKTPKISVLSRFTLHPTEINYFGSILFLSNCHRNKKSGLAPES